MSNSNLTVVTSTSAVLPSATDTVLGGVMVQSDSGLAVDSSGNLSVASSNPLTNNAVYVVNVSNDTEQLLTTYIIPQDAAYVILNAVSMGSGPNSTQIYPDGINVTLPTPLGQGHTINILTYGGFDSTGTATTVDGSQFYSTDDVTVGGEYFTSPTPLSGIATLFYNVSDTCWYVV